MTREHPPAERILFDLPKNGAQAGPFQAKLKRTDARK
jgi:hypothetical protein